jgi:hypothetical protein
MKYCKGDEMEDETRELRGTHWGEEKYIWNFGGET